MQLHLRAHAPCPSSIGRGSSKPAPCLHLRPRSVCRAWDSEETAARWQELPDVRQPSIQEQGPSSSLLPADPQATLQRVLEVVRTGNLDGMLEFCSDEVIDKLLALKQTPGWVIDLVQPVKQLSHPSSHARRVHDDYHFGCYRKQQPPTAGRAFAGKTPSKQLHR